MKTNRLTHFIFATSGLVAFFTAAGRAQTGSPAESSTASATKVATAADSDTASARWVDIKDHTFDMRVQFFAGFKKLEARVDDQIAELTATRAAMKSTANTKDWDFAMKEMENARSYLSSTRDELSKAAPETWDQQKDKVGQAWVRTQDAYAKVKSSTTA